MQENCTHNDGDGDDTDGAGDDGYDDAAGADDGLDEESGAGAGPCEDWDPDAYVSYDRFSRRYIIEQALVDDLTVQPSLLWGCDTARAQITSGGYYEVRDIGPDDLARQLALQNGDIILSVNGYDLQWPDDYVAAYGALSSETEFTLRVDRNGKALTLRFEVR